MTFDMAKFMASMRQDPHFKNFDHDAFEADFSAALKEHGPALEELARNTDRITAERLRSLHTTDPEQLRQQILQRELHEAGIDWARFLAGKQDEHEAVDNHLKKFNAPFTAADLLGGKGISLLKQTPSSGETITYADAQNAKNLTGESLKTFVLQRANSYSAIKNAAQAGDKLHVVTNMLAGGILAFGPSATRAALNAKASGASVPMSILAGVIAIGLPELGLAVAAVFAVIWAVVLVFSKAYIVAAVINWTSSALVLDDTYVLHGAEPTITSTVTGAYQGVSYVSALEAFKLDEANSAVYIAYFLGEGNIGLVGVNGAFRLNLARPVGQSADTGLGQMHIYTGYAFEKIGGTFILTGITSDASSEAFYQRHFSPSDSYASYGKYTVQTRLNDYPDWSFSAKNLYQLTVVQEAGV